MKPEVFVGLKAKNIFILNEYEKAKSVNENVVAEINHNEYKDVLLNDGLAPRFKKQLSCKKQLYFFL